jgi:hypothetical protein
MTEVAWPKYPVEANAAESLLEIYSAAGSRVQQCVGVNGSVFLWPKYLANSVANVARSYVRMERAI